ncbi:hypothetical protein GCM10009623_34280 [Nocardioides aestuarii]|uniref:SRPBCC family protein n=1 Tax=Nocardioides aestuarii TaxID=252231 RepID=A0ABW4TPI6_9ACTN
MRSGRRRRPDLPLAKGESVLAWAEAHDGTVVAGSRDALYLGEVRLPWERVEAADWDRDEDRLRVSEVGTWGEDRVEHTFTFDEPGRLLQLVRERVTASVVLQRHVPVHGRRGLRVVARRAPRGDQPVAWFHEYDEGVDPQDPDVRRAALDALQTAREELGQA